MELLGPLNLEKTKSWGCNRDQSEFIYKHYLVLSKISQGYVVAKAPILKGAIKFSKISVGAEKSDNSGMFLMGNYISNCAIEPRLKI